ncbi:MAG: hypothetical protein ACKVS8_07235 [Phycisphaerales bacterium]
MGGPCRLRRRHDRNTNRPDLKRCRLLARFAPSGCARCIAVAATGLAAAPAAAQSPTFTPLGFAVPAHYRSSAFAVSADGSVIAGVSEGSEGKQAFLWTIPAGMTALGDLPGGALSSHAAAISADGSVIVGTGTTTLGPRPFRWTAALGLQDLGALPTGNGRGRATGVSADGAVIVGASSVSGGSAAFRWTAGSGMVSLGALAGGEAISEAEGVSADGSTVVGYAFMQGRPAPFRWRAQGGMSALLDAMGVPGAGAAHGTNSDGSMVVGYRDLATGMREGFRWSAGAGLQGLGTLGVDLLQVVVSDVSDSGDLLVGTGGAHGVLQAQIWDEFFGLENLAETLRNAYGLEPQLRGWTLRNVYAVAANGTTLVGDGINPCGQVEAWAATFNPLCRPPQVWDAPEDEFVPEGVARSYTVDVRSALPMTHQWLKDGVPVADSPLVTGTTSKTINFLAFATADGGLYRLESTNVCGVSSTVEVAWVPREACPLDYNDDGSLNPDDLGDYITDYYFFSGMPEFPFPPRADFNLDGSLNPDDIGDYITAYYTGGC